MFRVKEVINGNEFILEQNWFHEGIKGNRVRILESFIPMHKEEYGFDFAKKKLIALIENKDVELFNPTFIDRHGLDILFANVYLDGTNVLKYFPEF